MKKSTSRSKIWQKWRKISAQVLRKKQFFKYFCYPKILFQVSTRFVTNTETILFTSVQFFSSNFIEISFFLIFVKSHECDFSLSIWWGWWISQHSNMRFCMKKSWRGIKYFCNVMCWLNLEFNFESNFESNFELILYYTGKKWIKGSWKIMLEKLLKEYCVD